ncbi:Asp-tRNA(Asn)/Glu-tRNA(Gln) amidotransferase subunit GatA [Stratiformator vulcanicus]|uniref:Glutamyl-tRNA(Gln) amidotransferase subunit A n=1 Tax=Stratiformator vulcanicus TaxID=2527980 RepID=A0A517R2R5_9PLAN|nr:Asp-tRNA(Asn)/Glu-tRNA(Gln) amidotransferase subunit GatA [Stratiformator vulcanicus]QDT38180.1 Glutamyl-tRNA(Gln) amidotransferase subunit A [Stratiformator vulcanicus]
MAQADQIIAKSADELARLIADGGLSSTEVTTAFLDRIDAVDSQVEAFLHVDREDALKQAGEVDNKRSAGEALGPLAGVPIAVKDVLCDETKACTCASRMLENFRPPYSSHVVNRLKAADAVLIGRTNMDEFAMGSSTENSGFQKTKNPWSLDSTPGGSSGGSAAAVAASMAPLALGTDTGGSIRQPAGFCGIVGLKPTYGRVSRYGLVAFASSLDQVGPMSHDVSGSARLLQAIAGHDPLDSTSLPEPVPDYLSTIDQPIDGLRIGICREHYGEGLSPEVDRAVQAAVDTYIEQGAEVVDVELPHSKYSVATYYIIAPSEASSNLARYDGIHYGYRAEKFDDMIDLYARSRGESFGAEVKRRIMLGTYALSAGYSDQYYNKALKVRRLIRRDFDDAFSKVDVILSPVTPSPAFKIGELADDPLAMYLSDIYTISANLAGIPGISIPAGQSESGLPIGLQLLGPTFGEETLFRAARMFEQRTDWHKQRAALA